MDLSRVLTLVPRKPKSDSSENEKVNINGHLIDVPTLASDDDDPNLLDAVTASGANEGLSNSLSILLERKKKEKTDTTMMQRSILRVMEFLREKEENEQEEEVKGSILKKVLVWAGRKALKYIIRPVIQLAWRVMWGITRFLVQSAIRYVIAPVVTAIGSFILANPLVIVGAAALAGLAYVGYKAYQYFFGKGTDESVMDSYNKEHGKPEGSSKPVLKKDLDYAELPSTSASAPADVSLLTGKKPGAGETVPIPNLKVGAEQVASLVPKKTGAAENKEILVREMLKAGMTNQNEQAMFLAQMDHESGGFRSLSESFNYKPDRLRAVFPKYFKTAEAAEEAVRGGAVAIADIVYGGRMGNNQPGDGYKYRGRGFVQLTGKNNYTAAGKDLGIDLVNNPDLASVPEIAAKLALWYWYNRAGLSKAAQQGDVKKVSLLINAGTIGLEDRYRQFDKYKAQMVAYNKPKVEAANEPKLAATTIEKPKTANTVQVASAETKPSPIPYSTGSGSKEIIKTKTGALVAVAA